MKKVVEDDSSESEDQLQEPIERLVDPLAEEPIESEELSDQGNAMEGGEEEMSEATESDCEVSSSDDELGVTESKKVQTMHENESSGDEN